MKKEIRVVDQAKGIVRITSCDERWYARSTTDQVTGLPVYQYVPSVTWIAEHYPKGIGFYKWLANTGWDEAEALKEAAGDKGSKVHQAISHLLDGNTVPMDGMVTNPTTGQAEPLTLEEYDALRAFAAWHTAAQPILVEKDIVVWNDAHGYAGTIDFLCRMGSALWLLDFKTSQGVWPSHELQVSAYKHARPEWSAAKLGILQIGYRRNRDGYKLTEVEDQFPLFLAAKQIWAKETAGQSPKQRDYPLQLQLSIPHAPAVPANGAGTATEPTAGGANGPVRGRTETDGLRKSAGGRVGVGQRPGSPVRRTPGVPGQK